MVDISRYNIRHKSILGDIFVTDVTAGLPSITGEFIEIGVDRGTKIDSFAATSQSNAEYLLSVSGSNGDVLMVITSGGQMAINTDPIGSSKLSVSGGMCMVALAGAGGNVFAATGDDISYIGGNAGISVASPQDQLDIGGDAAARTHHSGAGGVNGISIAGCDDGGAIEVYGTVSGIADAAAAGAECGSVVFSAAVAGADAEVARIDYQGQLGIGTITPGAALDIQGALKFGTLANAGHTLNTSSGSTPTCNIYWGDRRLLCSSEAPSTFMCCIATPCGLTGGGNGGALTIAAEIKGTNLASYTVCCVIAGTGISGSQGPGAAATIVNTDRVSSQNIYTTWCAAGVGSESPVSNSDVICFARGLGVCMTLSGNTIRVCTCNPLTVCCACAVCRIGACNLTALCFVGCGINIAGASYNCYCTFTGNCIFMYSTYATGGVCGYFKLCMGSSQCTNCASLQYSICGCNGCTMQWHGRAVGCSRHDNGNFCCLMKGSGSFVINHPCCDKENPNKYNAMHLVHGFEEAPGLTVFYEGKAELCNGIATVNMPYYFESLVSCKRNRYVQLTPINDWTSITPDNPGCPVENGILNVKGDKDIEFYWRVSGERQDESALAGENKDENHNYDPVMWNSWLGMKEPDEFLSLLTKSELIEWMKQYKHDIIYDTTKTKSEIIAKMVTDMSQDFDAFVTSGHANDDDTLTLLHWEYTREMFNGVPIYNEHGDEITYDELVECVRKCGKAGHVVLNKKNNKSNKIHRADFKKDKGTAKLDG